MGSERKKSNSRSQSPAGKRVTAAAAVKRGVRRKNAKVNTPSPTHFVLCVRNDDYPASLELRKLYPVLEDAFAAEHDLLRVIDESGEDYLYPSDFFVHIELPRAVEKTLAKIA